MGKKSRDKGGRGQRAVAKLLANWWGAEFTSTPLSGGFATKKFRDDWNAAADIVTPDETFPFSVEVKWQEDWHMEQLLKSEKAPIWCWWDQCVREAPANKIPLLVFKRNHQPWYYMVREADLQRAPTHHTVHSVRFILRDSYGHKICVGLFEDHLLKSSPDTWSHVGKSLNSRLK